MSRLNRDTLVAIFLLVGCGVFFIASFDIREPDYGQLSPATWPRVVLVVLSILSMIYLVQSIRQGPDDPAAHPRMTDSGEKVGFLAYWQNVIWCFALFLSYLLVLPYLGMLVGGMLFVFVLLCALGGWQPRLMLLHAVIAAATVGGMWCLFTFGLGVLLPRGELFN